MSRQAERELQRRELRRLGAIARAAKVRAESMKHPLWPLAEAAAEAKGLAAKGRRRR